MGPASLLLLAALAAPTTKVAVTEIEAGVGAAPKVAHLVTNLVTSELRQNSGLAVTSQEDIQNLLGFQKQKQLLSCSDVSCLAEVGGALGVDQMVMGSISALGTSYVLVLRAIDVRHAKVIRDVERRLRNATPDALLDVIPKAVAALYPKGAGTAPVASVSEITAAPPRAASPAPWWIAGAGAVALGVGLGMFLQARGGWGIAGGTGNYDYATATGANARGYVGQGIALGSAVAIVGGLAWGLLRPPPPQPQALP
ncbi:MAG: hypothetical protein ACYCWW_15860 [Deltaproteobacteria bacterium]